ncbi:hypothetical protein A2415_02780 [candidate division WWE3 bacterium RIFOXYC1_FULL_39_7]|uniref:Glycosyltransferase RgtA/B/C/D-like domain-containing protein n=2 Tax=Katanobacteria TaxID=422282 RepID=A0A1F4X4K3_UNCKA|nr:MAG: hypothetical protein A2415_02780 [candidate division WWE3 bacterium RIFOXYC1_FULL_39_7]OGC76622.1 MAG: hypothetical protein A2619_04175 [candidate division WWE3 bacterium RIFOXYD1_FULL_39_9]
MIEANVKIKYFFISLILALVFSGIFAVDLKKEIIAKIPDSHVFLSFIAVVKHNISAFNDPLGGTDFFRYPDGIVFRLSSDGVFALFSGAFLNFFFDPVVAYNLVVLLIFFSNIFLSLFFFTKIYRLYYEDFSIGKPILSALLFALSPYFFARMTGHLNLAFIGGIPFVIYAALCFERKIANQKLFEMRDYLRFFSAIIVMCAGTLQHLIVVVYIALFAALFLFVFHRKLLFTIYSKLLFNVTNTYGLFFVSLATFLGVFMFFFGGYVLGVFNGKMVILANFVFDVQILDFIIPNSYLGGPITFLNSSSPDIEKVVSLGFVGLVFFIYFFVKFIKLRRVFITCIIFYVLLSMSFLRLPAYYEGMRIVLFLQAFVSVLVLLYPSFLNKRNVYFVIAVLLVQTFLIVKIPHKLSLPLEAYSAIKNAPGDAVLVLPVSVDSGERNDIVALANKKLLDGRVHPPAANREANAILNSKFKKTMCVTSYSSLEEPKANFTQAFEDAKELGFRTIVVEHFTLERAQLDSSCLYFTNYVMQERSKDLDLIYSDSDYSVYIFK